MTQGPDRELPADAVRRAIRESHFLKSVAAARGDTGESRELRALTPDEIVILKAMHNGAEDWARIRVVKDFNPHKVVGSYFSGDIELGSFREKVHLDDGVSLGSGIYNSDLSNVRVGDNVFIGNVSLLANYVIGDGAVIQGCGRVVCTGRTLFGNGKKISLGLETPGRETAIFAEITCEVAAQICAHRRHDTIAAYDAAIGDYVALAASQVGIVGPGAVVQNTPRVVDTYIGPRAEIDSATAIENSTILSGPDEVTIVGTGSVVRDSIIQWGSRVETHALVEHSVCCEYSFVDSHGIVRASLIGPNSGVAAGECLHSLLGPFVGFHHQALLISAFWPDGKGNIGYGANIGSNHTGKAPDQEIWPGEGLFFGLGVNVRFPADFSNSPYSVIAAGVSTLPQRVEMPFSLLTIRSEMIDGISPAFNELLPGWVLSDNIFAIRRNERKYAVRNKARRSPCGFEVFRPDTVDLMIRARTMLRRVDEAPSRTAVDTAGRPVYTEKDVPGLGKNFMKETARLEGISAYTFYIRLYALKGLLFAVKFCLQQNVNPSKALEPGFINDPRYVHELAVMNMEFPGWTVRELLNELAASHDRLAADTLLSKEKDDFRGVRVIPDYAAVHTQARDDQFVRTTTTETEELKAEVALLLKRL